MANKYYYNKDYFKEISTADKAYWLGFLYADGYVCRQFKNGKAKSMNLELTVCEKDVSQLIKFKNCLESNIEIHEKNVKLNNEIYKDYKEINKRGVYWSNRNNAYIVTICNNRERERIGQYKNLEDAINARREAERIKTLNSQLS